MGKRIRCGAEMIDCLKGRLEGKLSIYIPEAAEDHPDAFFRKLNICAKFGRC